MKVITDVPRNVWKEICKEEQDKYIQPVDDDTASVDTEVTQYNPARDHPTFCGQMHCIVDVDADVTEDFDPACYHPACVGYTFLDKPPKADSPLPPAPPDKKTCLPAVYFNHYIFPWLLPILEDMLAAAKEEKCFEKRRTKFNVMDFLTEALYKRNPNVADGSRDDITWAEIPFVKSHLTMFPRRPLPMSLVWPDDEAALVIQSFWRGYMVRRRPDVQELRVWQRVWREDKEDIHEKVDHFWAKQMPVIQHTSEDTMATRSSDEEQGSPQLYEDDMVHNDEHSSHSSLTFDIA